MTQDEAPILIADRAVRLFTDRAVTAIQAGKMFDQWALDPANDEDIAEFLDGGDGAVRLCWDEAVIIYQRSDESVCQVRAYPVDQSRVVEGLENWAKTTWPPMIAQTPESDHIARDFFGPHRSGDGLHVLLSFSHDPNDESIYQAHLSAARIKEPDA